MMKRTGTLLLLITACLTSCSKLQYLDQAFAVKAYSDEQDAMAREVKLKDARFELLLDAVRSGEAIRTATTAVELERQWGGPVLKRAGPGQGWSTWLYRYQVKRSGPKVYVDVRPDGKIERFRLEE